MNSEFGKWSGAQFEEGIPFFPIKEEDTVKSTFNFVWILNILNDIVVDASQRLWWREMPWNIEREADKFKKIV